MARMYVLEVPENVGFIDVAEADPTLVVDRVGPYFRITSGGTIVIDRRATGARHAVWYSSVAGLEHSRVTQHDKDALRVEPK